MTDSDFLDAWESRPVQYWQALWRVPELHIFKNVGSTNDIVKARAEHGAEGGTLAIAEAQSRGRGRRERKWEAPHGTALLMSMLFRPRSHSPADLAGTIPLRVGMAVARAIETSTGVKASLKWPNDVVARDGRKMAGILCESSLSGNGLSYTVVGIGLNVLQTTAQLHADVRNTGVSLRLLAAATPDRAVVATALIDELMKIAYAPASPLSPDDLEEYARRDSLALRSVTADGDPVGVAEGVGDHGDLRVREGAVVRSIHAGSIRVVP